MAPRPSPLDYCVDAVPHPDWVLLQAEMQASLSYCVLLPGVDRHLSTHFWNCCRQNSGVSTPGPPGLSAFGRTGAGAPGLTVTVLPSRTTTCLAAQVMLQSWQSWLQTTLGSPDGALTVHTTLPSGRTHSKDAGPAAKAAPCRQASVKAVRMKRFMVVLSPYMLRVSPCTLDCQQPTCVPGATINNPDYTAAACTVAVAVGIAAAGTAVADTAVAGTVAVGIAVAGSTVAVVLGSCRTKRLRRHPKRRRPTHRCRDCRLTGH